MKDAEDVDIKLGFMPLSISHAGCFLRETKRNIREYLSFYDETFMTVQSRKSKLGWNYRNDTAPKTWEISFQAVKARDKDPASFLLTCSYLNPEEIYEELWEDEKPGNGTRIESKFV